MKKILGGLKGKKQVTVFEIEKYKFNKRNFIIEIVISIIAIITNIYFAITRYDSLPERIATKIDFSGNAFVYLDKNFFSAGLLVISIIFVSAIFIFIEYIISHTKLRIDPRNAEKSREGNLKYRKLLSSAMMVLSIITLLILTVGNLSIFQVINMGIPVVWTNILLTLLLILILVVFMFKAKKLRFDYKIKNDNVVQKDDDDNWVWGLFYYNKEDPRINVEKRFGVGYTINLGRPVGMAIMIGTFVLVSVLLIIGLR